LLGYDLLFVKFCRRSKNEEEFLLKGVFVVALFELLLTFGERMRERRGKKGKKGKILVSRDVAFLVRHGYF
jgi:hypothetical protein